MAVNQTLFLDTVRQLGSGRTQTELSEDLSICVAESRKTGLSSKLTLEITVKPDGIDGQYFLSSKKKLSLPQTDHGKTLMWGTPDGNLTRKNPESGQLDLRSVEPPEAQTQIVSTDR